MIFLGPISSIFDYVTYGVLYFGFKANTEATSAVFQTGWFVESILTQTLIIHIIRTNRLPFLKSRASWQLTLGTFIVMAVGIWLSFPPQGEYLDFVGLPTLYWPLIGLTLVLYVLLTQGVKVWLLKRGWL
jgi:P-type Mg2+ transporter